MKEYSVIYTITGRAEATIQARSLDEARAKAEQLNIVDNSDSLLEWSFDEVEDVREDI